MALITIKDVQQSKYSYAVYKNGFHVNSLVRPLGDDKARWRLMIDTDHGFTKSELDVINTKLRQLNSKVVG